MRSIHALGAVPFLAILVAPAFLNRVTPFVFGVPFLLAWLIFCVFLTSGVMGLVYLLDDTNRDDAGGRP
ncbi:Protein of unknown function [Arboricoccus pini]|uniref:DUF3311 domain-containing protein n=1 Tax=Arboricoccus pini TaxID=1963835 RepID=A0A212S1S8_9PROT|nr:DUF3311 domain-containing protein [Arboricoccus pini]SNB79095.1 Protein of unknown function [Arboricoccus pini]